jgi:hypothetical protein
LIQGILIKCVDGRWHDRDKLAVPSKLLALATTTIIQCWREQMPVDTIFKHPGQPLPNVDELNAKIPENEWEAGFDGKPKPPWQRQEICYLLDEGDAQKYTFASGTVGARIAVDELRDRVKWMRAIRGASVVPLVELANRPMRTQYGGSRLRPHFKITAWREFGVGLTSEQIEHIKPAGTAEQLDQFSQEKPDETRGTKTINPPTTAEELNDGIPF